MAASKLATDIITYWHWMMEYRNAASLVGKRYILDIEMPMFLNDCENEKVIKLMTEFMNAEKAK